MKLYVAYTTTSHAELFATEKAALAFVKQEREKEYKERKNDKSGLFTGYCETAEKEDKKGIIHYYILSWNSLESKEGGSIPHMAFNGYVLKQKVNE